MCGNLSKNCQIPVRDLSHAAALGNWLRVAMKNRPANRREFPALSAEIKMRRLIRNPRAARRASSAQQKALEMSRCRLLRGSASGRARICRSEDAASDATSSYRSGNGNRRGVMDISSRSEVSDSVKAQVIASLKRG